MKYHKELGLRERFKELCEKKGIKPFSLAMKGVNRNIIESIMRGSEPGVGAAYEVAQALDVTIEELLTGEEPQVKEEQAGYGYSTEEKELIDKAIKVLRSKNETARQAILSTVNLMLTIVERDEKAAQLKASAQER